MTTGVADERYRFPPDESCQQCFQTPTDVVTEAPGWLGARPHLTTSSGRAANRAPETGGAHHDATFFPSRRYAKGKNAMH